jgi:hypothetical protein
MTPTTDLQKLFTDGELRALLEQYPARPPTMGGSNVSHENSYLDHYVVSAWEKKCSAILKRREDAAPDLAARVLELEAENKRLREADEKMKDALAYYADDGAKPNREGPWMQDSIDFGSLARCTLAEVAALKGGTS